MGLAIDASTPVIVTGVTPKTTASFTAPANSLLVALCSSNTGGVTHTVTNSGTALTWTSRGKHAIGSDAGAFAAAVEIFTAPAPTSAARTVTLTSSNGGDSIALKVLVITGADLTTPVGQAGEGHSTTANLSAAAYTSSVANSRGVGIASDSLQAGSPTSSDTGFAWNTSTEMSGIAVHKAADTAVASTAVTLNFNGTGGSREWNWVAVEIRTGAVDASPTTTTVTATTTVPTPATTVSASPTLTTVATAAAVPAPAISASSSAQPSTVVAAASVPVPSVTTQNTTTVPLTTVTAATAIPSPAVTASASATPAPVTAATAVPTPAVRVDADVMLATVAVTAAIPSPATTVPVLPGDQITRPGQIEYRGFLLGSGTPYSWQGLTGWRSTPPIISGNVDRPDSSGSYPGQPYAAERVINWAMLLKAPRSQLAQVLRDLVMATGIPQSEVEDYLVVWDVDGAEPYLVQAHLTNRDPGELNRQARMGLMRGAIQWTASDHRLYSPLQYSAPIPKDVETDVLNDGNDASPPIIQFPGPATTVQVENITTDVVMAFNTTIADGQILEVDVKEGTVAIGAANHLNDLVEGSVGVQDFVLAPGPNTLLYTTGTGGSLMNVFWRHATS